MKLDQDFFMQSDTVRIARDLLGKLLVVADENGCRVSGMIVETEAYLGTTDRAAHTYGGRRTARNEVTYGAGGHAYVFFVYGMYYQLNVVCGPVDSPQVVLIRAVEPIEGIEIMRARRGEMNENNLTSGPGKLCIALGINRSHNGIDLTGDEMWLEEHNSFYHSDIRVGKRIGIGYAGEDAERPWRFWVGGNEFVSKGRNPER